VRRDDSVVLIVEGRLSPHLPERVLDVPAGDAGMRREFILRPKTAEMGAALRSVVA
jgi:hypothetical protein